MPAYFDAARIDALVPMSAAIEQLRKTFGEDCAVPDRQAVAVPGGAGDRLCLVMPAFDSAGAGMVKLSTVFPDNRDKACPTIQGLVIVFSESGAPVAVMDGAAITKRRTAAASALASSYLSRQDSARLLVMGTGELAPSMALAHSAVRSIRQIEVWGREASSAAATAAEIRVLVGEGIEVSVCGALEPAVAAADIVSCATSSAEPVVSGHWLKPGTFVDLVGSFSPTKREADDTAILRSRVFVDTFAGAMAEAGDILAPLQRGVIAREHVRGELADLVRERVRGRSHEDEITLFKSVGAAIEDLAIARLAMATAQGTHV